MSVEELVAKVLGISVGTVTDETSPDNTEEWDSFNGLLLASELEKEFDVSFTVEEVIAVKNVSDIKEALKRHNVDI